MFATTTARYESPTTRSDRPPIPEWESEILYLIAHTTTYSGRFPTSSIRDQVPGEVSDADRLSREWFETIFTKQAAEQRAIEARKKAVIDMMAATASFPPKKKSQVPATTRSSVGKRKAELPSRGSSAGSPRKKCRIVTFEGPLRRSSRSKKQGTKETAVFVERPDPAPKSTMVDKAAKKELMPPLAVTRPKRNRTTTMTHSPSLSTLTLSVTPSSRGLPGSSTAASAGSNPKNINGKRKRVDDVDDVAGVMKNLTKEPVALRRTSRVRVSRVNAAASPSKSTEVDGSPRKRRKETGQRREKP